MRLFEDVAAAYMRSPKFRSLALNTKRIYSDGLATLLIRFQTMPVVPIDRPLVIPGCERPKRQRNDIGDKERQEGKLERDRQARQNLRRHGHAILERSAQVALEHPFARPALLIEALTHPSAGASSNQPMADFERLEFLGDRVLGLVVARHLMERSTPGGKSGSLPL